jgi:cytochrome P450
MKFALHVITGAGFGVPFTWEASSDEVWPKHKLSFRDALTNVLHHLITIVLVPKKLWKLPIEILRISELGYNEFGTYMRELLEREKRLGKDSDGQNLMSALVKHAATEDDNGVQGVLQDEEIIGNTFIFLLAGHETTYSNSFTNTENSAHTLLYAFIMLAIHPAVQDTLLSEIQETIGDKAPTYEDFPNLVYPLCVMFETLRLFPSVTGIPKCTLYSDQMLLGKYFIPKNTTLLYAVVNVHRNPKYWGDDVHAFNPSRFDGRNTTEKVVQKDTGDTAPGAASEKIKLPVKGAFIPFSEGSRSCLGYPICILLTL